ncbi:MAG TPA: hypothetical protein VJ742_12505 [Nitrososphaera sp.]|nr:hypothetical protein [Nitrososphaera sp.]
MEIGSRARFRQENELLQLTVTNRPSSVMFRATGAELTLMEAI